MKITSTKHKNYIFNSFNGLFMINLPIKIWAGSILGILCYITGAEAKILEIIGMLLIADLFMGILAALKNRTLSSDYLVTVMYKAAMYFVLLMGANWFMAMCPWFEFNICGLIISIQTLMYFLISAAELISILENADLLGFKYAKKIIRIFNEFVENKLNKQ